MKATAFIGWSDEGARRQLLGEIVADAQRLLRMCTDGFPAVCREAVLLRQLLLRDLDVSNDGGCKIKQGTTADRMSSTTDLEQRHGRKSKRGRLTRDNTGIAVEPESQIIAAADMIAGKAPDATGAVDLAIEACEHTGSPVAETLCDCAYGNPETRQEFAETGIDVVAKAPIVRSSTGLLPKTAFIIGLEANTSTYPIRANLHISRHSGNAHGCVQWRPVWVAGEVSESPASRGGPWFNIPVMESGPQIVACTTSRATR